MHRVCIFLYDRMYMWYIDLVQITYNYVYIMYNYVVYTLYMIFMHCNNLSFWASWSLFQCWSTQISSKQSQILKMSSTLLFNVLSNFIIYVCSRSNSYLRFLICFYHKQILDELWFNMFIGLIYFNPLTCIYDAFLKKKYFKIFIWNCILSELSTKIKEQIETNTQKYISKLIYSRQGYNRTP